MIFFLTYSRELCGFDKVLDASDENYYLDHPEIQVPKKEDSPDEDKSLADSKALLPTLWDFFEKHPLIKPSVFLGVSAFDSIEIYNELLGKDGLGFNKTFIPLNSSSDLKYPDCTINEDSISCCPNDPTLTMKPESGLSSLRCEKPDSISSVLKCRGRNTKIESIDAVLLVKTLVPIPLVTVCFM